MHFSLLAPKQRFVHVSIGPREVGDDAGVSCRDSVMVRCVHLRLLSCLRWSTSIVEISGREISPHINGQGARETDIEKLAFVRLDDARPCSHLLLGSGEVGVFS